MQCKTIATLTAAMLWLVSAGEAQATFFTSQGSVQVAANTAVSDPPIDGIQTLSGSAGMVFTNQVNGAPFAVGSLIRTVTVQAIQVAEFPNNVLVQFAPDTDPLQQVVAFTALSGVIVQGGVNPVVRFTEGRAFVSGAFTPFDPIDPDTWQFDPIAQYDLFASDVVSGAPIGAARSAPGSVINHSGLNVVVPGQPSGQFLFVESSTDAQNALTIGDLDGDPSTLEPNTGGDNFIFDVDTSVVPTAIAENNILFEGLFVEVQQTVNLVPPGVTLAGSDLAVLNSIALAAELSDLDGVDTGFASALGAGENEFGGSGDFEASLATDVNLVVGVVPEPSSLALLAFGGGIWGCCARRRRSRVSIQ